MRIPRTARLLVLPVLIVAGFYVWGASQPPPTRPNVSVSVLGYTNDGSGVRLAVVAVTNLSSLPVFVYLPTIQIKAPDAFRGFTNYFEAIPISGVGSIRCWPAVKWEVLRFHHRRYLHRHGDYLFTRIRILEWLR